MSMSCDPPVVVDHRPVRLDNVEAEEGHPL
jgi:hypothetical protein